MDHRYNSFDRCVLLLSGGLDSTVLLHDLRGALKFVHAVSFSYGQRHNRELESARYFTRQLGVSHQIIDLPEIFSGSLVGDGTVPHGAYDDEQQKATVVPNRNMVMLSMAAAIAISKGCDVVAYAAHMDDCGVYPDCRPSFINAMHEVLRQCHYTPVHLVTPFVHMHKREIVELGRSLDVEFDKTWSCYEGGSEPCGKCGACDARRRAFQ